MTPFLQPFSQLNDYPFSTPDHQETKQPHSQPAPTASPLSATTSSHTHTPPAAKASLQAAPEGQDAIQFLRLRANSAGKIVRRRQNASQKRRTIFPALSERRSENGCILSFRRRLEASFPHKKSTSSKRRNAFVVPLFFKTLSGLLKTLNACHTSPATHSSYPRQSRFPDFPQPLHPGSFRTHFKNLLARLLSPADSRSLETGADFLLFPFSAFSCSL